MFLSDRGSVKMDTGSKIFMYIKYKLFDLFYSQGWVISERSKGTLKWEYGKKGDDCVEDFWGMNMPDVNVILHQERGLEIT